MRTTATRRAGSPLRPILRLLPLLLTLAAHATVGVRVEWERPMAEVPPRTWVHVRIHDDDSLGDNHHARSEHKVADASRESDKGDQGTPEEPAVDSATAAGEEKGPCEPKPAGSAEGAGGCLPCMQHNLRDDPSVSKSRKRLDVIINKGEEMRRRIVIDFHQPEVEVKYSDTFNGRTVKMGETSKMFSSIIPIEIIVKKPVGSVSIELQVQGAGKDFTRNRESTDGKKCHYCSEERQFRTLMRLMSAYIQSKWEPYPERCYLVAIKLPLFGGEAKFLPEVVQGINCRYDYVEGSLNECGKRKTECEKSCRRIADRTVCSCTGPGAKRGSIADGGNETPKVVRHCKLLFDPTAEECPPGYDLDPKTRVCVDIDECDEDNGGCSHECVNTNGGHKCQCPPGLFLWEDGKSCDDVDECAECRDGRTKADCGYNCTNTPFGFACTCPAEGFRLSSDLKSCEHLVENYSLTADGIVYPVPTLPAKEGKCPEGFSLDADNATCTDIDECCLKVSGCTQGCENLYGSYRCYCRTGFTTKRDRKTCVDFDECSQPDRCEQKCVNTEGSYRCECRDGYRLGEDRRSCRDIDECRETEHGCSDLCINRAGNYSCGCKRGYYLLDDRKTCQELDECTSGVAFCEQECENTPGSFRCKCAPGYFLANDRKSCLATAGARRSR